MVVPQAFPHKKAATAEKSKPPSIEIVIAEQDLQQQQEELIEVFRNDRKRSRRTTPLIVRRSETDAFYGYMYVLLSVAWMVGVVFVLRSGDNYSHEPTEEESTTADDSPRDWFSILDLIIGRSVDSFADTLKQSWPLFLTVYSAMPLLPLILGPRLLNRLVYASMTMFKVQLFVMLSALFLLKAKEWRCSADCLSGAERDFVDHMRVALPVLVAAVMLLNALAVLSAGRCHTQHLEYKFMSEVPHYRLFALATIGAIVGLTALTIRAMQFTSPNGPMRYFVLIGSLYLYDYLTNLYGMVVAQLVGTYYRGAGDYHLRKRSIFTYIGCVIRYHMGSLGLKTIGVLPYLQSLVAVCRYRFDERPVFRRSYFCEFFYRVHLVFAAPSYARSYVALNGGDFGEATAETVRLLMKYCSSSAMAFHRGMDSIVSLQALVAFVGWICWPVLCYGFDILPRLKQLSASQEQIWALMGAQVGLLVVFYVLTYDLQVNILWTSRLCLLEDCVEGKEIEAVKMDENEYQVCFDTWSYDGIRVARLRHEEEGNRDCELNEIRLS